MTNSKPKLVHRTSGKAYEVVALVTARCPHCTEQTNQAVRWCATKLCSECLSCGMHRKLGNRAAHPARVQAAP